MAGRPRSHESRQRTQDLLRLLGQGVPLADAARQAGVKPERVLRLLSDSAFRQATCSLLEAHEAAA